jgi:hypothetical protein
MAGKADAFGEMPRAESRLMLVAMRGVWWRAAVVRGVVLCA